MAWQLCNLLLDFGIYYGASLFDLHGQLSNLLLNLGIYSGDLLFDLHSLMVVGKSDVVVSTRLALSVYYHVVTSSDH